LRSILRVMDVDLEAPDRTTLSRRSQCLDVELNRVASSRPIHLIVDSTGLSIVGKGEWAAVKHGSSGKRAWKKLHLGVNRSGMIVAEVLTDGNTDDPNTALDLLDTIEDDIASLTADAAYDTISIYETAARRRSKVIIPPRKTAARSKRPGARNRTVSRVKKIGLRQWEKESGYHQQARVENTFFRYKSIIGDRLRARHPRSQEVEALIACNVDGTADPRRTSGHEGCSRQRVSQFAPGSNRSSIDSQPPPTSFSTTVPLKKSGLAAVRRPATLSQVNARN